MEEIEVTNFTLEYDGMYHLHWNSKKIRVFLPLDMILKMIRIEGLSEKDIDASVNAGRTIEFTKVTLLLMGEERDGKYSFMTSDFSEFYIEENLLLIDVALKK